MLVDTHAHLQFDTFAGRLAEVLERAHRRGVQRIVVCGTDLPTSEQAVALAAEWPQQLYATVGIHPSEADQLDGTALTQLRELAGQPGVVAIGEVGLDYYRDRQPRAVQREAFQRQQALALELGLPLVVHARGALAEAYEALTVGGGFATRVVMHCFLSEPDSVAAFLAAGCWLGTDGPITYPKAEEAREVVRRVPLERLLLETDCPFLAPQAWRGQTCEPAYLDAVAQQVAELKGTDVTTVASVTTRSAEQVFQWPDT